MGAARRGFWPMLGTALLAGGLGAAASLWWFGPGPLLHTPLGQWLLREPLAPPPPAGVRVLAIGEPVDIAFALTDLEGRPADLPGAGRPRLINYWASWCGPCVRELPLLDAWAHHQGEGGVQVVGIALEPAAASQAFLADRPVGFPIRVEAPGPADSSVQLGNTRGLLPFSVLIGADKRLIALHFGPFPDEASLGAFAAQATP
jgi:thiol-disulfide isomerase/thioredoxin